MSKKRSKKNKLDQPIASTETVSISWITTEMKGFIFLTFALVLFLSLLSFSYTPDTTNLLGQIGHAIGWVFHSIFGIVSYVWPAVIAWIGWRLFFNKSLNYLGLKIVYVLIASFSLALLISVIEKEFTELSTNIGSFFYPGLWFSSLRPHLGGAPFYYLYSDLPHLNLKFLLNSFGVSLIFTCSLITSLLFLFKLDISSLFNKMAAEIKRCFINRRQKNGQDESELTLSKDSDFLRYVKLRIPSSNLGADPECNLQNLETIEIEPQKNLTVRPSISSKNSFIADVDTDLLEKSDNYALEPEDEFISPKVSDKSPTKKKASLSLRDEAIKSQKIYNGDFTNFAIPDAGLLKSAQKVDQSSLRKDLKRNAPELWYRSQSWSN